MIALGSRGDVQPAIALAKGLQARGHAVKLVAGTNFEAWVRGHGLDFVPTVDMEALMKSPEGVAWVAEPNPIRQLGHMKKLFTEYASALYGGIAEPAQGADLLLSGFVSDPFSQAASEKFGIPMVNVMLQPYRSTRSGEASLAPIIRHGSSPLNSISGYLGDRLMWSVASTATNRFRGELGLPPHNFGSYMRAIGAIPTIFGFSPRVVPPPEDWHDAYVTGYWFLDEHPDWQPPDDLAAFLEAGAPPIYVGFGSMSSADPQATLDLIVAALRQTGQRAVIGAGWSGAAAQPLPDFAHLVDHAPHEWLFERVAAVVHHGGAGTTAAGLRAGKPTMVIPHLGDQPYWARRVYELGVGVKPVTRHTLTVDRLAAGIHGLVTDARQRDNAARLGEQIRAERGIENAVEWIDQLAGRPRS